MSCRPEWQCLQKGVLRMTQEALAEASIFCDINLLTLKARVPKSWISALLQCYLCLFLTLRKRKPVCCTDEFVSRERNSARSKHCCCVSSALERCVGYN